MVAFLGSTIGNLDRPRALVCPGTSRRHGRGRHVPARRRPGEVRRPAAARLRRRAGVTADFNRNVLAVLNRELRRRFDLDAFEHVAVWDADESGSR